MPPSSERKIQKGAGVDKAFNYLIMEHRNMLARITTHHYQCSLLLFFVTANPE
jgi:hypothetical protein